MSEIKIKVFFHRDADGILSAILFASGIQQRVSSLEVAYTSVNYDEPIEFDRDTDRIVFLDFNPSNADVRKIIDAGIQVEIFDHHCESFRRLLGLGEDLYGMNGVKSRQLLDSTFPEFPYRYDEISGGDTYFVCHTGCVAGGSTPTCMYFLRQEVNTPNDPISKALSDFVQSIGGRDVGLAWDSEVPFMRRFTMLYSMHIFLKVPELSGMLEKGITYTQDSVHSVFTLLNTTQLINNISSKYLEEYLEEYAKLASMQATLTKVCVNGEDVNVAVVGVKKGESLDTSTLGNLVSSRYRMPCIILQEEKFSASVRSSSDCPVPALSVASAFGGGGHERASGFSFPRDSEIMQGLLLAALEARSPNIREKESVSH